MELKDIDLSDMEFWKRPLEARAAAFADLRARPRLPFFAEPQPPPGMAPGPGYYAITRHADVVEVSRHPELFCSGQGHQHRGHAARVPRVLRVDDQPGRSPPRPVSSHRLAGVHAAVPGITQADVSQIAAEIVAGIAPARPVRLRDGGRRPPAVAGDRRPHGHTAAGGEVHLRAHQRHPGLHRPRIRGGGGAREGGRRPAHGRGRARRRGAGDRRRSAPQAAQRHHDRAGHGGSGRGDAQSGRAGVVLHPAGRRRQRDHPQRHRPRTAPAHPHPPASGPSGRQTSTEWRPPPSTRSCAGRPR